MLVLEGFGVVGFFQCKGETPKGFFQCKGVYPTASSYRSTAVASLYRQFEHEKQRRYKKRICKVEMGSFTPLVFSTFGGMAGAATTVYK